jgi:hypothetical protein
MEQNGKRSSQIYEILITNTRLRHRRKTIANLCICQEPCPFVM